jgi:hypothetical protein
MQFVLAKLKDKSEKIYRVADLDNNISYDIPDTTHEYDSKYKLDINEWFQVSNIKGRFSNKILENPRSTTDYNQIQEADYKKISWIAIANDKYVYFQKVTATQYMKKGGLSFRKSPKIIIDPLIVPFKNYTDAIYDIEKDILYFKNLSSIKSIFKNIESLYRNATENEIEELITGYDIEFIGKMSINSIGVQCIKLCAMITDNPDGTLNKDEVLIYYKEYISDIPYENGKFKISTQKQLKHLLYAIDERYYTTEKSGEKRLANSIKNVTSKS